MNYGLNNDLGTSNNTNRTQNSSKVNKNFKSLFNGMDILDGLKNGKNGGERIKGIVEALLSGNGKGKS